MGAILLQQGSLKLNQEQGLISYDKLEVDVKYSFKKPKHRLYMLETPMQLITDEWKAIATVMVTEIAIGNGETIGTFKVLKKYSPEEVKMVSNTLVPYQQTQRS